MATEGDGQEEGIMSKWPKKIWMKRPVPKTIKYYRDYEGYTDHWDMLLIDSHHRHQYVKRGWQLVPGQGPQQEPDPDLTPHNPETPSEPTSTRVRNKESKE